MGGQRQRGLRHTGRSRRVASWRARGAPSAAASGEATAAPTPLGTTAQPATGTRTTFRSLLQKGLAPEEAANLTAFLCGIHVGGQRWTLQEVNRLLFYRDLHVRGTYGSDDRLEA